jgi:surfactin synthase thioesterase subunit
MPADVEVSAVVLPGRESRLREPPLRSMTELVDALVPALAPHLDRPFAFFGHSFGALVAFEVARALPARRARSVSRLMVSGRRAPHLPDPDPPIHQLPDDTFVAEIDRRYGGLPAELKQDRELLELFLPGLRADIMVLETYRPAPGAQLDCPITAFGGDADLRAPRHQLEAWQQYTVWPLTLRQFPGGHFFLTDPRTRGELIGAVAAELRPLHMARPASRASDGRQQAGILLDE